MHLDWSRLTYLSFDALRPPAAYHRAWVCLDTVTEAARRRAPSWVRIEQSEVLIVFLDLAGDVDQANSVLALIDAAAGTCIPILIVLLGSHPASEKPRPSSEEDEDEDYTSMAEDLLKLGASDVVGSGTMPAEDLPIVAAAAAVRLQKWGRDHRRTLAKLQRDAAHAQWLKNCVQHSVWDSLQSKLAPLLQPANYDLKVDLDGGRIGKMQLGKRLGSGHFGAVYELPQNLGANRSRPSWAQACGSGRYVIKVAQKNPLQGLQELRSAHRCIQVVRLIRKQDKSHPNMIHIVQIMQTHEHVLTIMEHGGGENLYHRIMERDKGTRPLNQTQLLAILAQCTSVVEHIHSLRICHRDIKPENYVVNRPHEEDLVVKLADFDFTAHQPDGHKCRTKCGTFPFMAPEVSRDEEYCGLQADVWSLGMVLLEVVTKRRLVERVLGLTKPKSSEAGGTSRGRKLEKAFLRRNLASQLLQENVVPEGVRFVSHLGIGLDSALVSSPVDRKTAEHLRAALEECHAYCLRGSEFSLSSPRSSRASS